MSASAHPEELVAQVNACYNDMVFRRGNSWETELLERLMADSRTMKAAWKEIAKRSHPPDPDNASKFVSIYGLCFEFIELRREAFNAHPTPNDRAERFRDISKSATWLATAIDGTKLDRVADPYLKVTPGKPTPVLSTLLKQLSAEAKELAAASQNGPNLLQRPGSKNSLRTYIIRRLATAFDRLYGGQLQRTLASFAEAILGEGAEVTVEQVNSALQNWSPVEFDSRGEYL